MKKIKDNFYNLFSYYTVRTSTLVFSSAGSVSLSENFFTQSHSSAQSCTPATGRPGWPVSEESYSQEQWTVNGLQITLYRVQVTVYSVQCTEHSSCLCSVCIDWSLHYMWDWSLPDHCQSSAPAGGENTLHTEGWGEGVARQKKKNVLHKFHTISTKPLVKEMTDQIIIILKVILKGVTNIKVIMKAMKETVVTVVTRMVVTVIMAINR